VIICIGGVLDANEVNRAFSLLKNARFIDGSTTAGWAARNVKNNLQLIGKGAEAQQIEGIVQKALARNNLFLSAALPKSISKVLISKSLAGMGYGQHVDNALMGNPPIRTDIAFTIFLSDNSSYKGGELAIEDLQGEQTYKLRSGEMILYPATTLHCVKRVDEGERVVIVGWVQSLVKDSRIREMLYDLDEVRKSLFNESGNSHNHDLIQKSYSNLLRLHMEI
jgi:PKHD-type hydroxylase